MDEKAQKKIARFLGDEFVGGWEEECDEFERNALLRNAADILSILEEHRKLPDKPPLVSNEYQYKA